MPGLFIPGSCLSLSAGCGDTAVKEGYLPVCSASMLPKGILLVGKRMLAQELPPYPHQS